MQLPLRILGIPGSLRHMSYSRAVLLAAQRLVPSFASLDLFDLHEIPPLEPSTADAAAVPAAVLELKRRIRAADAVLFCVPEHLFSGLTVLGNAIEWAASPAHDNAWRGKPVAVVGASEGERGTATAQHHLRQRLPALQMRPVRQRDLVVGDAASAFDRRGNLLDDVSRDLLRVLLADLVELAVGGRGHAGRCVVA